MSKIIKIVKKFIIHNIIKLNFFYKNKLLIKLNGESQNRELNFLSRILRQHIIFENLILVFDYEECKK